MKTADLEKRFLALCAKHNWLSAPRVLLGVSGGGDSMALLHLFLAALGRERLVVAHMDHGLRASSVRDREFVVSVCAAHGVCCVAEKRPVARLRRRGESIEQAGRRLRYEFFEETCARFGCELAALGHTRDDVAESVIMNLARGTGLRGLAGIPLRRGRFIRPLLDFAREELRGYLRGRGLAWVEDETNDRPLYLRNRVRSTVLPCLTEQLNAQAARHLAELAAEARVWREEQERRCAVLLREARLPCGEWPALSLVRLRRMSAWDRGELLRFIGRELELTTLPRARLVELERLIITSGRWVFQWGSEVDLTARGGSLTWHPAAEKLRASVPLRLGGETRWGGWRAAVELEGAEPRAADEGFSVTVAVDPEREIELTNGEAARGYPFPVVCQRGRVLAGRDAFRRERTAGTAAGAAACRLTLTPLKGKWRVSEWNLSLRTS